MRITAADERAAETGYARGTFTRAPSPQQIKAFVEEALAAMRAKNPQLDKKLR